MWLNTPISVCLSVCLCLPRPLSVYVCGGGGGAAAAVAALCEYLSAHTHASSVAALELLTALPQPPQF